MSEYSHVFNEKSSFNLSLSKMLVTLKNIGSAKFETMGIVFDQDQFEALLESLTEAREGKVVSLKEAFSDL